MLSDSIFKNIVILSHTIESKHIVEKEETFLNFIGITPSFGIHVKFDERTCDDMVD